MPRKCGSSQYELSRKGRKKSRLAGSKKRIRRAQIRHN